MCVFMCGLFGVGVACERSQRKSTRIARRAFYKNTIPYRNSLKDYKVCWVLNLPYTMTLELTFENF